MTKTGRWHRKVKRFRKALVGHPANLVVSSMVPTKRTHVNRYHGCKGPITPIHPHLMTLSEINMCIKRFGTSGKMSLKRALWIRRHMMKYANQEIVR